VLQTTRLATSWGIRIASQRKSHVVITPRMGLPV